MSRLQSQAASRSLAGLELVVEEEGGIGEFFLGGLRWAKENLGGPALGKGHEAHAFLQVAVAGEEFESFG